MPLVGPCKKVIWQCKYCNQIKGGVAEGGIVRYCQWCSYKGLCGIRDVPVSETVCMGERCLLEMILQHRLLREFNYGWDDISGFGGFICNRCWSEFKEVRMDSVLVSQARSLPVAVVSHCRPYYLRRVLQTLKSQWDQAFTPYLFQDGVFNWASGRKSCGGEKPGECMEVWEKEGFQRSSVNTSSRNLGPPHMFWWILEDMLGKYPYLLILEDDYVVTEDYIGAMKVMLSQFMGMNELARVRKSELKHPPGVVSAHGHHTSPKEDRWREAWDTRSGLFHLWGWGITREGWRIMRGKYEEYLGFIGDFRERDNGRIREWFRQHGADMHATGSDGGLHMSMFFNGLDYVNTMVNRGRYIGEKGTNMTSELFRRWDWPSIPAEAYPIKEFNPPENSGRFFEDIKKK